MSIQDIPFLSGGSVFVGSGATVGQGIDLLHADTYCNLFAAGVTQSGKLRLQVQCSDTDVSGNYTDPTSGMAQLPGAFQSGAILWINSGQDNGILGVQVSGQSVASGWAVAQGFVRTGRFARVIALAEATAQYGGGLAAGFISNLKTTGSGGGFTMLPGSGAVNV